MVVVDRFQNQPRDDQDRRSACDESQRHLDNVKGHARFRLDYV